MSELKDRYLKDGVSYPPKLGYLEFGYNEKEKEFADKACQTMSENDLKNVMANLDAITNDDFDDNEDFTVALYQLDSEINRAECRCSEDLCGCSISDPEEEREDPEMDTTINLVEDSDTSELLLNQDNLSESNAVPIEPVDLGNSSQPDSDQGLAIEYKNPGKFQRLPGADNYYPSQVSDNEVMVISSDSESDDVICLRRNKKGFILDSSSDSDQTEIDSETAAMIDDNDVIDDDFSHLQLQHEISQLDDLTIEAAITERAPTTKPLKNRVELQPVFEARTPSPPLIPIEPPKENLKVLRQKRRKQKQQRNAKRARILFK